MSLSHSLSVYVSVAMSLSHSLSLWLCLSLSLSPSLCGYVSVSLSLSHSLCGYVSVSLYISLSLSVYVSVSLSLSVCLSMSLSNSLTLSLLNYAKFSIIIQWFCNLLHYKVLIPMLVTTIHRTCITQAAQGEPHHCEREHFLCLVFIFIDLTLKKSLYILCSNLLIQLKRSEHWFTIIQVFCHFSAKV